MEKEQEKEFNRTTRELIELLSGLDEDQLNRVPFRGSWSAGQLGHHLWKSYAVVETLRGRVQPANRVPDQKIVSVEKLFLDHNLKMESPEELVPSEYPIEKEGILKGLRQRISELETTIREEDLSLLCLDFAIPQYGKFTRLEWIAFTTIHTRRHVHQLQNMLPYLHGPEKQKDSSHETARLWKESTSRR